MSSDHISIDDLDLSGIDIAFRPRKGSGWAIYYPNADNLVKIERIDGDSVYLTKMEVRRIFNLWNK